MIKQGAFFVGGKLIMVMFEEYTAVMAGLQFICRTARKLSKLPDN